MLLTFLVLLFVLWLVGALLKIALGLTFAILGLAIKIVLPLLIIILLAAVIIL